MVKKRSLVKKLKVRPILKDPGEVPKKPKERFFQGSVDYQEALDQYHVALNKRADVIKKNSSRVYVALNQALFGGDITESYHPSNFQVLGNGEKRQIRPDIEKITSDGIISTEVKCNSVKSSAPHCGHAQVENFFYTLLERRLDQKQRAPSLEYSFFRYGSRETKGFHYFMNEGLIWALSQQTKDLLIVPSNLLIFMLKVSPFEDRDQSSSEGNPDNATFWKIRGSTLSFLHKYYSDPQQAIGKIIEKEQRRWDKKFALRDLDVFFPLERKDLFLENLVAKQYSSGEISPNISLMGKRMIPFKITQYSLGKSDYSKWLDYFSDNHERILAGLGIRDVYSEVKREREKRKAESLGKNSVLEEIPF